MSQQFEGNTRPFAASGALSQYRRVRLSGTQVAYAGAGDGDELGTLERDALAAAEVVPVRLRSAGGTRRMVANGAVTAGNVVFAAASGKISATGTIQMGIALEAATADGDIIEVLPYNTLTQLAQAYGQPLNWMANGDLSALASSPAAGKFGLTAGTYGTNSPKLTGETANNNSKTDDFRFGFVLPPEYAQGGAIKIRVAARITGNVQVAQTIVAACRKGDRAAGIGANLVTTSAITLTTSFVNCDFTVTPTGLQPGDFLDIDVTGVANDTGGAASKNIEVGAVDVILDVVN